ncbi:acyl-CoA dehydrogenase family protein [Novosphingobium sp. PP1Y]|uniref:acyl-CoA dehydrogenase family protein n=1 Tax=Novosphingobium sp. PP1Y TaxID=702113 RepID=UPI000317F2E9|nr:acyl-CoA dehydrogenase family protein [Novosphingobium sp. PP1Y]
MEYRSHIESLCRHLEIAPFRDALEAAGIEYDADTWQAVVEEAGGLCEGVVAPVDCVMDRQGARFVDGRVVTVQGHCAAWQAYAQGGWIGLPLSEQHGGMGLPLALQTACEELLNRASPAFAMLATPNRTAAQLLAEAGSEELAREWVPRLIAGEWGATICISEPDAGSDVGRIRTRAVADGRGGWRITGEKCWISFGAHDLTARIGHFMLARSGTDSGVRGLSLFLVPDRDENGPPNGVFVRRIEEKLGLHGSPTCAMGFEDARGVLIGAEGRGLQTLFHMMLRMRLSCGPQGVGVATGAFESALRYSRERRQGGRPDAPPVPICEHVDVQRMLLQMAGRIETARGLSMACAIALDLATCAPDAEGRDHWSSIAQFLLPLVKDGAARLAFDVSSTALQVFGGAGYTREWPVEQRLRDARVFAVFEGTTGMQAADLVHRRIWREEGEGLARFAAMVRADLREDEPSRLLARGIASLERVTQEIDALRDRQRDADAGAVAYLDLCTMVASGWIALRILHRAGDDGVARRMKLAAACFLAELPIRAAAAADLACLGADRLEDFRSLFD